MTQTFSIKGLTTLAVLAASTALTLGTPAVADKASNTLNVAFAAEPEPLDTYKIAGRQGLILARHIYDGLLYKNLDTGEIVPALAESWEFTGPLTMEFTLRQGVKFHNGADFTADDVVETLNTVITPEYGTRYSISVDWIDSVEKLDDYKVRINMSKPFAGAVEMLADALPIYPHAFFAENGSAGMAATPIGTGPYKLVSQEPGIRYEMERFEDHYEGSPKSGATIDKISVRTIPEMNTQYAELMSGSLDWIWRIPPDQASRLEGRVQIISAPIMRIGYVGFAPRRWMATRRLQTNVCVRRLSTPQTAARLSTLSQAARPRFSTPHATRRNSAVNRMSPPMNTTRRKPRRCWPKPDMRTVSRWKWSSPPCRARLPKPWPPILPMSA